MVSLRRFTMSLLVTSALVVAALTPASTQQQLPLGRFRPAANGVPDEYAVVLTPAAAGPKGPSSRAPQVAREMVALYGGRVEDIYTHVLNGFALHAPEGIARAISEDPRVDHVQQATPIVPADTEFNPPSWGLDRVDQHNLPLNNAFDYHVTGAGVNAYVIDSGIRFSHVEFSGRAHFGADFIGDGQNGNDCRGHGTHVAGTIGGSSVGVAKAVVLWSVRVLPCTGPGTSNNLISGIQWVTANHGNPAVANISIESAANGDIDNALRDSIAAGITYVVAAGNGNVDASTISPARVSEAITVGGTDINDVRGTWSGGGRSNYGSVLDVFAPGKDITSAWYTSDTATAVLEGTSMATPHVTGVAAQYLQLQPSAWPAFVSDGIRMNATAGVVGDAGPGSPNQFLYSAWVGEPAPVTLASNEALFGDDSRLSPSGAYRLIYQLDGNLVIYRTSDGAAIWASGTVGTSVNQTVMQGDGNLVIYDGGGTPVWSSGTAGNNGAYLFLGDKGAMGIYDSSGIRLLAVFGGDY